ncbi:MAG TPA: FAD:protein FMN transferase [Bryobacteraceae bacterium]|nr:FAD:protein FMN transferase [Bryobacteraceae bacterium]
MGTTWSIQLFARGHQPASRIQSDVAELLERIEGQMSHYRRDSDLGRFNASRGGRWVSIPLEMFQVLNASVDVALESGGAFDPTLGRLVSIWGFGPGAPAGSPPGEQEILEGLFNCGWSRLLLDRRRRRVWQPGGIQLNLSSIAKGYAVDQTAKLLDRLGIENYLVEFGGELRSRGVKLNGQPWWIAIEQPPGSTGFPEVVLPCADSQWRPPAITADALPTMVQSTRTPSTRARASRPPGAWLRSR